MKYNKDKYLALTIYSPGIIALTIILIVKLIKYVL